jgi:hypothetical protein
MPRAVYSAVDCRLLDALFALVASCASLAAEETAWTRQQAALPSDTSWRLDRVIYRLRVLGLLVKLLADRHWTEERSRIRGEPSANRGRRYSKRIPVMGEEEQRFHATRMERPLPDLLLFPGNPTVAGAISPKSICRWPRLASLTLSQAQLRERGRSIGGSDANIILSGDNDRVLALWREKRGEVEPEDLTGKLSVVLGSWTEDFNRQWYERVTGQRVADHGKVLSCSTYRWRKCTLDGLVAGSGAIFEAKHTNAFVKPDDVLERYMPQLQHNMAVAKTDRAVLSVIFGNARYETFEVRADWLYQRDLLEAEKAFWCAVVSGEPPVAVLPPAAPRPVATREINFDGNNAWAAAAADWRQHQDAAKTHASACRTIKDLLEHDVVRAFGHGIEARRNKAGAITIRTVE